MSLRKVLVEEDDQHIYDAPQPAAYRPDLLRLRRWEVPEGDHGAEVDDLREVADESDRDGEPDQQNIFEVEWRLHMIPSHNIQDRPFFLGRTVCLPEVSNEGMEVKRVEKRKGTIEGKGFKVVFVSAPGKKKKRVKT